jgi:glycerate kinase
MILERNLQHFAAVIKRELGVDIASISGGGAAGGLAAGLVALAGGKIEPGAKLVAEKVGLSRRLKGTDLAITGEGRLDASSASGKAPFGVLEEARMRGVPVICIAGQVADDAPAGEFAAVEPLVTAGTSEKTARLRTAELLADAAAQAVQKFLARRP